MKILITGGAGYIGSITAAKLLRKDHEVIILDNLETGYQSTLDKIMQDFGEFEFIQVDLRDKEKLGLALDGIAFDAVIHFAAYIEVGRSVEEPEAFFENNYEGTKNLLKVLDDPSTGPGGDRPTKFIFSSTAAVYGHPKKLPIPEDAHLDPINPYGEAKVKVEKLLEEYAKLGKADSIRLRYFNPAGSYKGLGEKHKPETHLIPLICKAAKGARDKLFIFGDDYDTPDGTPIRDYIHVEELVDSHIVALEHLMKTSGTDVFNVGTGKGHTVKEVFETAKEVIGKNIPYEIVKRRSGDSRELVADPTKINQELGWKAGYNLEDIIQSAWEFENSE